MRTIYRVLIDRRLVRQSYEPIGQPDIAGYFRMFDFVGTDIAGGTETVDGHYEFQFQTRRKKMKDENKNEGS